MDFAPEDDAHGGRKGRSWWKWGRKASTADDSLADEAGTEPPPAEMDDDFGPTVELALPSVEVPVEPEVHESEVQESEVHEPEVQVEPKIDIAPGFPEAEAFSADIWGPEIEDVVDEVADEPAPAPTPEPEPEPAPVVEHAQSAPVVEHAPSAPEESPRPAPAPWAEPKAPLSDDPMSVRQAAIREMLSIGAEWDSRPAGNGAKPAGKPKEGESRGSKLPWKRRKRGKAEGLSAPGMSKSGSGQIAFETTAALIAGGKVSYDIPAVPSTRRGVLDSPDSEYLVVCSRCGQPSRGGLCDTCEDALGQLRQLTASILDDD
jgi:hypothetical protein